MVGGWVPRLPEPPDVHASAGFSGRPVANDQPARHARPPRKHGRGSLPGPRAPPHYGGRPRRGGRAGRAHAGRHHADAHADGGGHADPGARGPVCEHRHGEQLGHRRPAGAEARGASGVRHHGGRLRCRHRYGEGTQAACRGGEWSSPPRPLALSHARSSSTSSAGPRASHPALPSSLRPCAPSRATAAAPLSSPGSPSTLRTPRRTSSCSRRASATCRCAGASPKAARILGGDDA